MKEIQQIHQAKLSKWTALFHEQADSALTVREWCKQNSLSLHAFYYWKRLAKEQYFTSLMPFLPPSMWNNRPIGVVWGFSSSQNGILRQDWKPPVKRR